MRKKKYFMKLLVMYLAIILSYTAIVAGYVFYMNREMIQLEIANRHQLFIKQNSDRIDSVLSTANNTLSAILAEESIIRYATDEETDYYSIIKANQSLSKYQSAYSVIGFDIAVTKLSDNMVITATHTTDVSGYFSNLNLPETSIASIKSAFSQSGYSGTYFVLRSVVEDASDGIEYLTIVRREKVGNQDIYIFLTFNEKILLPKLSDEQQEAFIILKKDSIVAMQSSIDDDAEKPFMTGTNLYSVTNLEKDYIKIGEEKHSFEYIDSIAMDWRYVYLTGSQQELDEKIRALVINCLWLAAFLAFTGALIVYYITQRAYRPIANIVRLFSNMSTNAEQDEMKFITDTATEINKANEKLRKALQNSKITFKIKLLREILVGILPEEDASQLEQYDLSYLHDANSVVICEFSNYKDLNENFSRSAIQNIQAQILVIFREQLSQHFRCEVFEIDYKRFLLIINETEQALIKKIITGIIIYIETNFDISLIAAIGQQSHTLLEIQRSYNSAIQIIEQVPCTCRNMTVTLEDLKQQEDEKYYYPHELEGELINYIIVGKAAEAKALIQNILDQNLKERQLTPDALSSFKFAIASTARRIIQKIDKSEDDFFDSGKLIYLELKMCEDSDQLERLILNMFNELTEKAKLESEHADASIASNMLDYIHGHYNIDISLSDIAEHFNLSQCYLSIQFKNATGYNYKEYLDFYRVKKAKEIMGADKNIKIKDLASSLGYNNANSFIRMFNRYEGMSPGQYSKMNASSAQSAEK